MVPDKLYKIIQCHCKGNSYYNGFTFYNEATQDNRSKLLDFKTTVSEIQTQTGL